MTRNFLKGALRRVLHEYTKGKSTERLKEAREVMLVLIAEEIDSYLNRRAALDEPATAGQQAAGAAPEGWVLVPREPTPKMIDATWNDPAETANGGGIESHNTRNARIYKAMLAAAPQPGAQEQSA